MTASIAIWIGAIAGLVTLAFRTLAEVRDRAHDEGWVKDESWLGRSRKRALQRRLAPSLAAIGITADHFDALRGAADSQTRRRRESNPNVRTRPDQVLVAAIKPWIVQLDEKADFRGNDRYVDTMGLVHHKEEGRPSLAAIADAWISLLQQHEAVRLFDCVLALKEGNPVLVTEFCNRISPTGRIKPFLAKGKADPARLKREGRTDVTDFEGLRAFLRTFGPPPAPRTHYRVLAIDDNCTSGRTFYGAITDFNDFVQARPDEFPFEPITEAAVLFVVKAEGENEFAFEGTSVNLHAMLALGSPEMQRIERASPKTAAKLADGMKDHPACVLSSTLGKIVEASEPIPPA